MQVDPSQELLKRLMMGGGGMPSPDMGNTPQQAIPGGQFPINTGMGAKFPFMQGPVNDTPRMPMPVDDMPYRPMPMPNPSPSNSMPPNVQGSPMKVGMGQQPPNNGGGMMNKFKALAGMGPAIGQQIMNSPRRRSGMNYSGR